MLSTENTTQGKGGYVADITTAQVAEMLGTSRQAINVYLQRHPELKPKRQLQPSKNLIWTEDEVQRLIEAKANKSKGGRPKKG